MLFNGRALIFTFSGTQVRIAEIERLQSLFKMSMVHIHVLFLRLSTHAHFILRRRFTKRGGDWTTTHLNGGRYTFFTTANFRYDPLTSRFDGGVTVQTRSGHNYGPATFGPI